MIESHYWLPEMKRNLLIEWKKECDLLSSDFVGKKQLERSDIDTVYKIFSDYFGINYFDIENSTQSNQSEENWILYLLANSTRLSPMTALFEIANILLYLQSQSKSIQKKFKSLFNDPRQFRDLFFELYIFRLFDYNNIQNIKKPKEGNKELDIVCNINSEDYLCECRKIYAPNQILLNNEKHLMVQLYLKLATLNKGFGLIGKIKFNEPNSEETKKIFENKLNKFVEGFNAQKFLHTIDYHDKDQHGEFSVVNYSVDNNLEADQDFSKYHIVFKIIPPQSPRPGVPNHYRVELKAGLGIPDYKILAKLFSTLKEKRDQHINSKYAKKVYFIDSEAILDFQPAIFMDGSAFPEAEIQNHINTFSDNEIFCFILRDYMSPIPKVTIKVLGRNVDDTIKHRLENLQTNFDFTLFKPYIKSNFLLLPNFKKHGIYLL